MIRRGFTAFVFLLSIHLNIQEVAKLLLQLEVRVGTCPYALGHIFSRDKQVPSVRMYYVQGTPAMNVRTIYIFRLL